MKKCVICGKDFLAKTSKNTCSEECRAEHIRKKAKERAKKYRKKQGKLVNIGSGNHPNNRGKTAPNYKNGISFFHKYKKEIINTNPYCNRCGIYLDKKQPYTWALHHKDHNRENNEKSNFELLCKRCHQLEHECWKNLPKSSQTIESTSKKDGSK